MNVASAATKRAEGEEQKEGEIQGNRKPNRGKGEEFDPNAPQKFSKASFEDDDFTVVTNVKPTFNRFEKNSVNAKPLDMTKAPKNENKFSNAQESWGLKRSE